MTLTDTLPARMDATLHAALTDRLEASPLRDAARAEVRTVLGPPPSTDERSTDATSPETFLRRITVEGFRGIGPAATLDIPVGPGLTVVVGRNGSGKSSFAEALELVMTGTTKRWESKTKVWSDTWQCLHHDGPTRITAELQIAGVAQPVALEQTWAPGVSFADDTGRAGVAAQLREHGWDEALEAFRPFLAYAELASMFDKLTSLYEALSPILGLEDLDAVVAALSAARLEVEKEGKSVKAAAQELAGSLDAEDPRQAALAQLLTARTPDLDAIRTHLVANPPGTGMPGDEAAALRALAATTVPTDEDLSAAFTTLDTARAQLAQLASTDSARALALANLLSGALALRDPGRLTEDCPVCGTADVLTEDWAARAEREAGALREQAGALSAAEAAVRAAEQAWDRLAAPFGSDAPPRRYLRPPRRSG